MPLTNPGLAAAGAAGFIEFYGHSFFRQPVGLGVGINTITVDQSAQMNWILASALNIGPNAFRNHAQTSARLTAGNRAVCGFARPLAEIRPKRQVGPFQRTGGTYFCCWGINDIGNISAAAAVINVFKHGLRAFISRARASAVFDAGGTVSMARGANWAAPAAATFQNITGGTATRATVVDSAGSSTVTFTIPFGYKGEPVCFAVLSAPGTATGGDITFGGTVTGTSGIIGTVLTTDSLGVNSQYGIMTTRFTAAANGLSAHNAGQTITLVVSRVSASGEIIIDSAWIEAFKPNPVVVCNQPRLPCHTYTVAVGDVGTTVSSATITSNTANFVTATDATAAITETDAQGAFTAGKTISTVTNVTTAVMSATAAASKTNVEVTIARIANGYIQYASNTNFSGATVASHSAADADVATLNAAISSVVAEFDSMVQIADIDTALGAGDTKLPSYLSSYFNFLDYLHPNEFGNAICAAEMFKALQRCAPADAGSVAPLEMVAIPSPLAGSDRWPRRQTGQVYLPPFASFSTLATFTVIGTYFAVPIVVTESGEKWGAAQVEVSTAFGTQTNLRWAVYDDPNWLGYPQNLWKEPTSGATVATGTTTGVKALTALNWNMEPGLYWLVLSNDTAGVGGSVRSLLGPSSLLPSWAAAGGSAAPIGWTLTGQAAGVLPNVFPVGATLVTNVPAIGVLSA